MEKFINPQEDMTLNALLECGMVSHTEVATCIHMVKEKKVLKKHPYAINKRSDGRYVTKVMIANKRKQLLGKSYEELIGKLYTHYFGMMSLTLKQAYEQWLLWRRDNTAISPKTIQENTVDWRKFLAQHSLIKKRITTITVKDLKNFFLEMTKDRSYTKQRVNNVRSLLNGIFEHAIELEILTVNPLKSVNFKRFPYKIVDNREDVYTSQERERLLTHLATIDEPYSLAIQLDFYVTMRVGELIALKWEDVRWQEKLLYVHRQAHKERALKDDLTLDVVQLRIDNTTKGHTPRGNRYIPLVDSALSILGRANTLNPNGEYIFMPYEKPMNQDTLNEYLARYCKEAGVPYRSSHKIRFSSASSIYSEKNLAELSACMGHSNIQTTLRYIRSIKPSSEFREGMAHALELKREEIQ